MLLYAAVCGVCEAAKSSLKRLEKLTCMVFLSNFFSIAWRLLIFSMASKSFLFFINKRLIIDLLPFLCENYGRGRTAI